MATISATEAAANQPKWSKTYPVVKAQTYVTTATLSAGDVIVMSNLKIPTGATIYEMKLIGDSPDGSSIFQIGTGGSAALFGSATISATTAVKELSAGLPHKVSVSDDATTRYVTLQLTQDGAQTSGTASFSLTLEVKYTADY